MFKILAHWLTTTGTYICTCSSGISFQTNTKNIHKKKSKKFTSYHSLRLSNVVLYCIDSISMSAIYSNIPSLECVCNASPVVSGNGATRLVSRDLRNSSTVLASAGVSDTTHTTVSTKARRYTRLGPPALTTYCNRLAVANPVTDAE